MNDVCDLISALKCEIDKAVNIVEIHNIAKIDGRQTKTSQQQQTRLR